MSKTFFNNINTNCLGELIADIGEAQLLTIIIAIIFASLASVYSLYSLLYKVAILAYQAWEIHNKTKISLSKEETRRSRHVS